MVCALFDIILDIIHNILVTFSIDEIRNMIFGLHISSKVLLLTKGVATYFT
jgi:hypothetical protein